MTAVRWVKSHPTKQMVVKHGLSVFDLCGNAAADKLADQGAHEARVGPNDRATHIHEMVLARSVQKRLLFVHKAELESGQHVHEVQQPAAVPVMPQRLAAWAVSSRHALVSSSAAVAGVWCSRCKAVPHKAELMQWLREPCMEAISCRLELLSLSQVVSSLHGLRIVVGGNELHESHSFMVCKGIYFCRRCGYYSGVKPQRLVAPCSGVRH